MKRYAISLCTVVVTCTVWISSVCAAADNQLVSASGVPMRVMTQLNQGMRWLLHFRIAQVRLMARNQEVERQRVEVIQRALRAQRILGGALSLVCLDKGLSSDLKVQQVSVQQRDSQLEQESIARETRPFSCNSCEASFSKRYRLARHQREVHQPPQYQCNTCSMRFARSYSLKQHEKKHSGQKPYACPLCNKRFAASDYLSKHLRRIHHTERHVYMCAKSECRELLFPDRSTLCRHIWRVHRKPQVDFNQAQALLAQCRARP